jgi:hypothetical protein
VYAVLHSKKANPLQTHVDRMRTIELAVKLCVYLDLIKSMPGSPYHMSLMAGLWNRDLLKKVLIPDETPWDIEISGTVRVSRYDNDILVLGTRQWPMRHTLAFRGGDHQKLLLHELNSKDVEQLRELGYIE